MTTKTKQEAQCCQDLAVRCAKAELERDALRDSERIHHGLIAAMSEQELRREYTRKLLDAEIARLKIEALRTHPDAAGDLMSCDLARVGYVNGAIYQAAQKLDKRLSALEARRGSSRVLK